ncbi:MAG: tetratricopeptide repeat protein [Longimicrobiales bacterium]
MNERWQRLRDLLGEALELAPDRRAAFVAEACAEDPALRDELMALLEAHEGTGPVDRVEETVREILEARAEAQLGERVGPYRLVRVIDYGGMGEVYLAEREGDFTQRVAIKLTRVGLETPEVIGRFVEERQILARLEHPNIARLLDGGITPGGRPYFAMEYVEGVPLHEYWVQRQLAIKDRLRLFLQVCNAVQYAHQNLIVHRDLKPLNILVTRDGQAKLLDFGIAKLLAEDVSDARTRGRTSTTMRWFAPEYAAPEQVRAQTITTATDIYALGLILYELLTGARAHRWGQASPAEIERIIIEREPDRPSAMVEQSTLRRQLAGDLDTIVLKALQKEPARRYASAEQFAEDIERYLHGLPVRARPDTLGYRTTKFVRRHRVILAAASVVAITLVGGIAATTWQARAATQQSRVARSERDRAQLEAERAAQVSNFLVDLFRPSDPREATGDTVTARELLQRGMAQIQRELADQPATGATLLDAIGTVYRNLGRPEQAQQAWEQALALRRTALGRTHPDVAATLLKLGILHRQHLRLDLAEPLLREAYDVWTRNLNEPSADVATALSSLGDLHLMKRDFGRAEQLYRQALDVRRKARGAEHPEVAFDIGNLATLFLHTKPLLADSLFSAALAIQRKTMPMGNAEVLRHIDGLATARQMQGRLDDAETMHKEALAIRIRLLGEQHPDVSFSLENLASVAEKKKDFQAAETYWRQALAAKRRHFGAGAAPVSRPLIGLGRLLHGRGRCAEATALLREALEIRMRATPPNPRTSDELRALLKSCRPQAVVSSG